MKKLFGVLTLVTALTALMPLCASAQDTAAGEPGLIISRIAIATDIVDREPQGVDNTFPAATPKIYCFIEANNITKDTNITFIWMVNDQEILASGLTVKAGFRFRTWAEKHLHEQAGQWKVEVRDAVGNVLSDIEFTVE